MTADVSSDDQRDLWFLNTRVLIRVSYQDGADDISVLEHWAALGDSPPLHVHHSEDEVFLGFKWSSQHLERGGCDGRSEAAFGSVRARRVALAWSALCCAA